MSRGRVAAVSSDYYDKFSENQDYGARIASHVERHLGSPSGIEQLKLGDLTHLDLLCCVSPSTKDHSTFVSSGLGEYRIKAPICGSFRTRVELLVRLDSSWHKSIAHTSDLSLLWPFCLMAEVSERLIDDTVVVGPWCVLPLSSGLRRALFRRRDPEFGGVMFAPPLTLPPSFGQMRQTAGLVTQFYGLVPLFTTEMEFKERYGVKEFFKYYLGSGATEVLTRSPKSPVLPVVVE